MLAENGKFAVNVTLRSHGKPDVSISANSIEQSQVVKLRKWLEIIERHVMPAVEEARSVDPEALKLRQAS